MIRFSHANRFAPRLHELETRDVPAGNVTVTQLGAELRVSGDSEANNFTIHGRGPGVVEIQGHGTTINGDTAKVTMTGVEWLLATGRSNDDEIKTFDLMVATVTVTGDGGNDNLQLSGTKGVDLPSYYLDERGLELTVGGGDGDDIIRITGTEVEGNFASITVEGNQGQNTITIDNTKVEPVEGGWGGFLYLFVYSDFVGEPGVGNNITIDRLKVDGVAPDSEPYFGWLPWSLNIYGADGDDTIRLHNMDLSAHGNDTDLFGDTYVSGFEGTDRIEVVNSSWRLTTPAGTGRSNQLLTSLDADHVTLRNVQHEGGTFDGMYSSGSLMLISAAEADLKNVDITSTTGFAYLGLSTFTSFDDDLTRATTFSLAEVKIRGVEGSEYTDFFMGEGNDTIRVTNSELGSVSMNLGEGNDSLTFVNVDFNVPRYVFGQFEYGGIFTGGGDDTVNIQNCEGENLFIDTGDGDDTVTLTNNTFAATELHGGDGTDVLNLYQNSGLFFIDEFEL